MPKKLRSAVELMAFKCRTLKVKLLHNTKRGLLLINHSRSYNNLLGHHFEDS
jgi:hypothetical protein